MHNECLLNNGTFKNMSILSRGIEYQINISGNRYLHISNYGFQTYSLINKGGW